LGTIQVGQDHFVALGLAPPGLGSEQHTHLSLSWSFGTIQVGQDHLLDNAAFKGGREAKGVVDLASVDPALSVPALGVDSSVLDPLLSSPLDLLSVLVKLKVAFSSVVAVPKVPKAGLALAEPNVNNPAAAGFSAVCLPFSEDAGVPTKLSVLDGGGDLKLNAAFLAGESVEEPFLAPAKKSKAPAPVLTEVSLSVGAADLKPPKPAKILGPS
jgi:hypothetical protein